MNIPTTQINTFKVFLQDGEEKVYNLNDTVFNKGNNKAYKILSFELTENDVHVLNINENYLCKLLFSDLEEFEVSTL